MTRHPCVAAIPMAILWSLLAAYACADQNPEQQSVQDAVPDPRPSDSGLELRRFPIVLAQNLTTNLFARDNLIAFAAGASGALAISPADQEISRSLRGHAHGFGEGGDTLGLAVPALLAGGMYGISRFSQNDRFRSFGYTLAQAYATNAVLTRGIKYATHRRRPDGSDSASLVSGHSSDSFAVATVVSHYYGKKWGIPMYAFAGLVGISRIEKGRHWPSDVIAGAALGYISGRTAIKGSKREAARSILSRLAFAPALRRDEKGLSVWLNY